MIPREVREEAYGLYVKDVSPTMICEILGLKSDKTLHRWAQKYGWKEKRAKAREAAKHSASLDTIDERRRLIDSAKSLYSKIYQLNVKRLTEEEKRSFDDLITAGRFMESMLKHEELINGEPTEIVSLENKVVEDVNKVYEECKEKYRDLKKREGTGKEDESSADA